MSDIRLVSNKGSTVLQARASNSAGAAVHPLAVPAQGTLLAWRWKIDRPVASADMATRNGDDFAARVYVFFDVPASALTFGERIKLRLARTVMGHELPRAALCYVWDNTHPVGTIAPNAYYGAVRTIDLQSVNAHACQWQSEHRDVAADFRAAFGRPAPSITGVAVASDTDNTRGHVNAWFGDLTFSASTATPESTDE
jgi:hypothetical protein